MSKGNRILITGATGKVGQALIRRLLENPAYHRFTVRALCHQRELPENERLEIVRGSIEQRQTVETALEGVSHVVHLATCKETPDQIMDVAVKGLFWLLETCRSSPTFQQFILIGGDAGVGHCVYPHPIPVTETQKHSAYPGCYALSKVLEEVMLEQYYIQYQLNGCCLRAPWIMEKDDFKYQLSFGEDVFGGPRWRDLVGPSQADEYLRSQTVPIMLDPAGKPVKRNFVHLEDLVSAIVLALDHPAARQQTFNICMDEPVDYAEVAAYLAASRGLPSVEITTPFFSTWLDNTKAKFLLGWRPEFDLKKLIDAAWDYRRAPGNPRVVWYPPDNSGPRLVPGAGNDISYRIRVKPKVFTFESMKYTIAYKHSHSISCAEYGDPNGYPILIQHGLIASIRERGLFEQLIRLGARLICTARPGYGASTPYAMKNIAEWADIVAILIDHLELSHFDVFGISSGAPYSYSIGHKFPNQVRNIFILSGTPALFDARVLSFWPYPVNQNASMAELEALAFDLFFSRLSQPDLEKDDIREPKTLELSSYTQNSDR